MALSFRTKRTLKRILLIFLIVISLVLTALAVGAVWMGRFQVYSRDRGVWLDFVRPVTEISGIPALPPEEQATVSIYYNEGANAISVSKELEQIVGYYVTEADLSADAQGVLDKLKTLPTGTPVMVDVKNVYGDFFYSSRLGDQRDRDIDPEIMDQIIRHLKNANMYAIARMPSMPDYYYGLRNVGHGLHHSSGLYLWSDNRGCYYLNPASDGAVAYWVKIITELKDLGFDEVVLDEYQFPENASLLFSGDRAKTLGDTAQKLVSTCATESFAVSFVQTADFAVPEGRSRIYRTGVVASEAAAVAEASGVTDPTLHLVFLTDVHDTRFDAYSVLRPLSSMY